MRYWQSSTTPCRVVSITVFATPNVKMQKRRVWLLVSYPKGNPRDDNATITACVFHGAARWYRMDCVQVSNNIDQGVGVNISGPDLEICRLALSCVKSPRTNRLITIVTTNFDLFALGYAFAIFIESDIHGGFAAATTNRLHFFQIVGQREQCF